MRQNWIGCTLNLLTREEGPDGGLQHRKGRRNGQNDFVIAGYGERGLVLHLLLTAASRLSYHKLTVGVVLEFGW